MVSNDWEDAIGVQAAKMLTPGAATSGCTKHISVTI